MAIVSNKLKEMVISRAVLPSRVFHQKFDRHLFFDIDICTSCELMRTVQTVVGACFWLDGKVEVHSAVGYESLDQFYVTGDWVASITKCEKYMRNAGVYDGLILLDADRRWALFQSRPVDLGVFVFNSQARIEDFVPDVYDYFFSCVDVRNWISRKTEHDIDMVRAAGAEVLNLLIKNYCV